MSAIDAVGSLQGAAEAVKKSVDKQPNDGPSMETLTQRFQEMMKDDPHPAADGPDATNGVTAVLDTNERLMQHNADVSEYLATHVGQMSGAELQAAAAELMHTQSISHFRNEAVTAIATSTSKSAQALLKNS
jgi:hypothetical protein